jgi:hypothetical protein
VSSSTAKAEPGESLLNPQGHRVPHELQHEGFAVRRQQPDDNARDYDAVMSSKDKLRAWSDSTWPEDDFTAEANAHDLAEHIDEHEHNLAYGYSILTPDEHAVLGSLYLLPVAPLLDGYHADEAARAMLARHDVRVEYWLRDGTDPDLELALIRAVVAWVERDWWFERPVFGSRRGMHEQRGLYERAGLRPIARLESKDGPRVFHFHAR